MTHRTVIKLTAIVDKFVSKFGEALPNDMIKICYARIYTCTVAASVLPMQPVL